MRRLLLSALFVTVMSSTAFADSLYFGPNYGAGGNFSYAGYTNGQPLYLSGGSTFHPEYAPGSGIGGSTTLWVDYLYIDGEYEYKFAFPPETSTIFVSPLILPPKGPYNFEVLAQISFSTIGHVWETGQTIELGGSTVEKLRFSFSDYSGMYVVNTPVEIVPEPGALVFVGIGIMGDSRCSTAAAENSDVITAPTRASRHNTRYRNYRTGIERAW